MPTTAHSRLATVLAATAALWVLGGFIGEPRRESMAVRVGYWNRVGWTLPLPLALVAGIGALWEQRRCKQSA